jgi:adenosylmethionine-8-amino-7-oxononanoate aminotransferase
MKKSELTGNYGSSGALAGGHTFQAHPVACAAALAKQKIIKRDNVIENVRKMGLILESLLQNVITPLPMVGNVRGKGEHPFTIALFFEMLIESPQDCSGL